MYSFLKTLCMASVCLLCGCTGQDTLQVDRWSLTYNAELGGVDIRMDSLLIYNNVYAAYRQGDRLITTRDYPKRSFTKEVQNGAVWWHITYRADSLPQLVQSFCISPDQAYVLTEFTLEAAEGVASNYMAPVNVDRMPLLPHDEGADHVLFIPFDNDCWIRYQSHPLSRDTLLTSYEVTALFNNKSRHGWVVGSVEHDTWKTAVTLGSEAGQPHTLTCYGGVADKTTRDSKPHGTLKGTHIKSPRILLGYFDDWRDGLEAYADANAAIAPPKAWDKAVPFGWNSWGALQFRLNYPKAMEVSDFYRDRLQNNHFENSDHLVYIGLDSGWNSFSEEELTSFAKHCQANGQVPCVYWTPFTDWGKNPERPLNNIPGNYRYKDVYLYANGRPQELDGAYALDPTHPAVEAMMKQTSELFHRVGFEYVKMDFMTHGAMETDHWYNPDIQTGIQGYNYGMQLLDRYFGDLYLNLSISPLFPAHYAQSRRIACDAWNKIKDTEYTLNALSYGWWQDRVYCFNDPDHIVLRDATDGENRARVTSGVITGLFICGDDFSKGGKAIDKQKAETFLTHADINAIADGRSFRPVEGDGLRSEHRFVRMEPDGSCYYAVFNYTEQPLHETVSPERLGLSDTTPYEVTELWQHTKQTVQGSWDLTVAPQDVRLYNINPKSN